MSDLTAPDIREAEASGLMGSLGRAVRVLYSPLEVFKTLDKRPDWLVPLLICVLIGAISSWILIPNVIVPQQREALEERGMTEEQLEAVRPWVEGNRMLVIGMVMAVLGTPLMFLVVAGIFHFVCSLILAGQANFVRTFAVMAYSFVVMVPEAIVKVPLQVATKNAEVQTSLGLLLSREASDSFAYRFLYNFLAQFDFFTFWKLVLIAIGISVMFKFSRQKSYYAVGGVWLIWALGSAVVTTLVGR